MSNPRETIIAAVVTQLEKVRKENGYANDVGLVLRADILPDQLNEGDFPAFYVLDPVGGGTLTFLDKTGYQYRLPLTIGGVAKIQIATGDLKSADRAKELNYLINDIWRALLEDPTFGGACKDSVLVDGPGFVDVDRNEALYNCQLIINLYFQRSSL